MATDPPAFNPYSNVQRWNPAIYGPEYVTFHNTMFNVMSDGNAAPYTPITAARLGSDEQIIPFQVGLLPPYARNTQARIAREGLTWQSTGSGAAGSAQQASDARGGPINDYLTAQDKIAKLLQDAQDTMRTIAPLRMLINPTGFSVSSSKIFSDGNWGRNGPTPLIEYWGEGQDTIQAQGKIAGFYGMVPNVSDGLTRANRHFTASYQNFLSLYLIYRNNGTVWVTESADSRSASDSKPNNLALVGSVYIYYDHTLYLGSFNSFQITEEAEAPYTLSYSFEFVVRNTVGGLNATSPTAAIPQGWASVF